MRSTVLAFAAGIFFAVAFQAAPAHAQLSSGGGPVSYSADNLEYFDGERRLVLTGDVDIVQNDARLRANSVTLYFSASTAPNAQSGQGLASGDIERMIADGEVYYLRPQQSARGNRAVYDVAQDSVTFSGNVVIASDENVIRGDTLVMHISQRQTVIQPQGGGRVRGVFVPSHGANTPNASGQNSGQHSP